MIGIESINEKGDDYSLVNIYQIPTYNIYSYNNTEYHVQTLPSTFEFVPGEGRNIVHLLNKPKYLDGIYTISKPKINIMNHLEFSGSRLFPAAIHTLDTKLVMDSLQLNVRDLIKSNGVFEDLITIEPTNIYLSCNIHVDFSLQDNSIKIDSNSINNFSKTIYDHLKDITARIRVKNNNEWFKGFHVHQVCFELVNGRSIVLHFHIPNRKNINLEGILSHFHQIDIESNLLSIVKLIRDEENVTLKEGMGNVFITYQLELY